MLKWLSLVALALFLNEGSAAAYPDPRRDSLGNDMLVNDFVGVFSSDQINFLNNRLRDHEAKTTNEVAVVVIQSLNGETIEQYAEGLFREWGIGKKDQDNGVLILIATDEPRDDGHKGRRRIEVGYGLEAKLTDGLSGEILRANRPAFDEGRIAESIEGIVAGVLEVITPPPPMSAEEKQRRQEARQVEYQAKLDQQKHEQERKAWFGDFMMTMLLVMVTIVTLGLGGQFALKYGREKLRKRRERREKREEITRLITLTKEELDQLRRASDKTAEKYAAAPPWIFAEAKAMASQLRQRLAEAEQIFAEALAIDWRQDDQVDDSLLAVRKAFSSVGLAKNLKEDLDDWPGEAERLKELALDTVVAARGKRDDLLALIGMVRKEGFRCDLFPEDRKRVADDKIREAEEDIANGHDPRPCQTRIEEVILSFEDTARAIGNLRTLRLANEKEAEQQRRLLEKLRDEFPGIRAVFDGIRRENPETAWADLAPAIEGSEERFQAAAGLLAEAAKDNSFEKQEFQAAQHKIKTAGQELGSLENVFSRLLIRNREIAKARDGFQDALKSAEDRLQEAMAITRSEDVRTDYSGSIGAARSKLKEVSETVRDTSSGLVDWMAVVLLLLKAEELSDGIIGKAKAEIRQAEEIREEARRVEAARVKRIQNEAKERAKEARREARRAESRRQSSSSSHRSSGFKFGSGRSGGGGASD